MLHAAARAGRTRRYTAFTFGVTQWRTQFRQRMNKLDNEAIYP